MEHINSFFYACTQEILKCDEVQQLKYFTQHRGTTRLDHSISVAYHSYRLSIRLGLTIDNRSLIRGALLHDFFLYDWREQTGRKGQALHGFTHPREALNTASRQFDLNKTEQNIILRHMWPLTITPPSTREALIVSLIDKYCTVKELLKHRGRIPLKGVPERTAS